jgi:phosphoserine phosphatase
MSREPYVLTAFGTGLSPDNAELLSAIGGTQKSSQSWSLHWTAEMASTFRLFMRALAEADSIDLVLQTEEERNRPYQLAVFDMDSTLIQCEVIDELAKRAGVGHLVAEITASAMRGEIDFAESFRTRLRLLKGLPQSVIAEIADTLPLMPGAVELFKGLKTRGIHTAICSGGFQPFAERLQTILGIDEVHTNGLEIQDGLLTGEVNGPIMDGPRKAETMRQIAAAKGIPLENTIAVGDGANDLPMIHQAGLGIAFHAKPIVREQANHSLVHASLEVILDLIADPRYHRSASFNSHLDAGLQSSELKPSINPN